MSDVHKLMRLNYSKMGKEAWDKAMADAISHLEFCLEIYDMQEKAGRYYLHEHPAGASSWNLPQVRQFILDHSAHLVTMDMCCYGMVIKGKPTRKPTRWMTNSESLMEALSLRCKGDHEHAPLIGGNRSQISQVYPEPLCRAIVDGFKHQIKRDREKLSGVSIDCAGPASKGRGHLGAPGTTSLHHLDILNAEEDTLDQTWQDWIAQDDVKGGDLPPHLDHQARRKEVQYLKDRKVYKYSTVKEAYPSSETTLS